MRDANPIELAYSVTKSIAYFRHARWREKDMSKMWIPLAVLP
ncbi:MAG: hypothetical protein QXW73_09250 [Nitrososphaerales archaeon]